MRPAQSRWRLSWAWQASHLESCTSEQAERQCHLYSIQKSNLDSVQADVIHSTTAGLQGKDCSLASSHKEHTTDVPLDFFHCIHQSKRSQKGSKYSERVRQGKLHTEDKHFIIYDKKTEYWILQDTWEHFEFQTNATGSSSLSHIKKKKNQNNQWHSINKCRNTFRKHDQVIKQ